MESREPIIYSRRTKGGQRPVVQQQPLLKNNHFQAYRSTKQWVEETSKQCKVAATYLAERRLLLQQPHDSGDGAAARLSDNPQTTIAKRRDGRGVHFKQENEQSNSRSELKASTHVDAAPSYGILRKDYSTDSHAAALSPISLNVAASGRQASNSIALAKPSNAFVISPEDARGRQGRIAPARQDGQGQNNLSQDIEERQVVWCNAAFEADDEIRSSKSQDSATGSSNRLSSVSCGNVARDDITVPLRGCTEKQERPTLLSQTSSNPKEIVPPASVTFSPAASNVSANAGSSPATIAIRSPEIKNAPLPRAAQSQMEAGAGDRYTPRESKSAAADSPNHAKGTEIHVSLTSAAVQPRSRTSSLNEPCPVAAAAVISSLAQAENLDRTSRQMAAVQSTDCELASVNGTPKSSTPGMALSRSRISSSCGPRSSNRAGSSSGPAGKSSLRALNQSSSATSKQRKMPSSNPSTVEADLEADIEQDIEHEISKEIQQLTQRLAALHAKQESRCIAKVQEPAKAEEGGGSMSRPQTPQRRALSPDRSESASKRKGRVVAAKFLPNNYEECSVKRGSEQFADKNEKFNESPFSGKPNPPRRSLGTPARLLTKSQAGMRHRSTSPCLNRHHLTGDSEVQTGIGNKTTKITVEDSKRERALLEKGSNQMGAGGTFPRKNFEDDKERWNSLNDRGGYRSYKEKEQQHRAPCLSTGGLGGTRGMRSHFYPEFERKVDWVKSLRNGPVPPSHPCAILSNSKSQQVLDERFTKQKSERQDVHTWLTEHMLQSSGCTRTGEGDGNVLEDSNQKNGKKRRMTDEDHTSILQTPSARSTRPSNGFISPSSNAHRPSTPNRFTTPNGKTTPSKGGGRMVPSRYGTPIRTTPAKTTPVRTSPGSRSVDFRPSVKNHGARELTSQLTPGRRYSKDLKDGMAIRKSSPTTRRGYPSASEVIDVEKSRTVKYQGGGVESSKHHQRRQEDNADNRNSNGARKITVIDAEYEKFVEEEKIVKQDPVIRMTPTKATRRRNSERDLNESISSKRSAVNASSEPPSSCGSEIRSDPPPRKIYIRCSDFIKDKHSMLLMKGKLERRRLRSGPRQENVDGSVLLVAANSNQTKADYYTGRQFENEMRSKGHGVGETRLVEKTNYQGEDEDDVRLVTSSSSVKASRMPECDVVYGNDFVEGYSGPSTSYLPEDYTLEMMLQYVDTLKSERECLPRIRATKEGVVRIGHSPRDSGCIKRTKDGERRARCYFNGGGGDGGGGSTNKNQLMPPLENEALSPSEIEGLDLESFWCLVGELEGPNLIKCP